MSESVPSYSHWTTTITKLKQKRTHLEQWREKLQLPTPAHFHPVKHPALSNHLEFITRQQQWESGTINRDRLWAVVGGGWEWMLLLRGPFRKRVGFRNHINQIQHGVSFSTPSLGYPQIGIGYTQTTDQLTFETTTKADSRGMFSTPLLV